MHHLKALFRDMLRDPGYEFPNLLLLALTGFAQMPIFKRYYIADHVLNGAVRGLILMAVVIPGIFLVVRNLSGYTFSPDFIIFSGHWPPLVFNGGAVLPGDQKGLDNRSSTTYE